MKFSALVVLPLAFNGVAIQLDRTPDSFASPTMLPRPGKEATLATGSGSLCNHHSLLHSLSECIPCSLHPEAAPRLFVREESMGAGTRLHGFLNGMAVAGRHGMNFGGVVSLTVCGQLHGRSHGVDILEVVTAFLGLRKPEELFTRIPPAFEVEFEGVEDLEEQLNSGLKLRPRANYLLSAGRSGALANVIDSGKRAEEYYNEAFLSAIRWPGAPILSRTTKFRNGGYLSLAMHVRRGDMSVGCTRCASRVTPDRWNYWILGQVRRVEPRIDMHVFSSLEGKHSASEFDEYRKRAAVHLDDEEILDAWAHFALADVVVLAKSSFSIAPALLNPNCVIYQHYYLPPLPQWIVTRRQWKEPEKWKIDEGQLVACIKRVRETKFGLQ